MTAYDPEVLVVGGGPTGLMLAAELRLQDVRVTVLERDRVPTAQVRSLGLHARSLEVLASCGVLDRFLALGTTYPVGGVFAGVGAGSPLEIDSRQAHVLGVPQTATDRLLEEWARELGADVRRGVEVVSLTQDEESVEVRLADGSLLRSASRPRACSASCSSPTRWPAGTLPRRAWTTSAPCCASGSAPTWGCARRASSPASATPRGWPSGTAWGG